MKLKPNLKDHSFPLLGRDHEDHRQTRRPHHSPLLLLDRPPRRHHRRHRRRIDALQSQFSSSLNENLKFK
jgi:hypothetical protein